MSKIVSMSSGAIDPIAQTKRVFWRPVTTTTVLKIGQPVCYNSDEVKDHKYRTADPTHLGLAKDTYEEGAQEFTARLFCVEEPLYANFEAWAGIVKSLGSLDGANGDFIEIYIPNGAVVPVYTDVNCTVNQSLLGIRNGQANMTIGEYGRIVAVAKETKDRSGSGNAGLVWAKIGGESMFQRQGEYSYRYIIEDEAGGDVIVNCTYVESKQTAGQFLLERIDGLLSGAGHMQGGMVMIRGAANAAMSGGIDVVNIGLSLGASTTLYGSGSTNYANCVLALGLGTSGTPNLSTGCAENTLCAISINYHVNESGGAPQDAYAFMFHSGTYNWDGLMHIQNSGDLGEYASETNAPALATGDIMIPINIGGAKYYLVALADTGL